MSVSITTQNPNYRALSTQVPVGYTQIFVTGEYAGTITLVTRLAAEYWTVHVRPVKNAFRYSGVLGASAKVWKSNPADHPYTKTWVADYWDNAPGEDYCIAGESYHLRAALAVAIDSATERGHDQGLW